MRRLVSIFMALAMLALLSFGCGTVSNEAKVKCPKCGAVFTIHEGVDELRRFSSFPKSGGCFLSPGQQDEWMRNQQVVWRLCEIG